MAVGAIVDWSPDTPIRPWVAGQDLLVGEWHCNGEARPWTPEVARHAELELPREGVHLRALGAAARHRHVVDATAGSFTPEYDDYQRASPTSRPQTSTMILLRGELMSSVVPRQFPRVFHVSSSAAKLHFRLLRARDPVAIEETALALAGEVLGVAEIESPQAISPSWRRLAQELQHVMATRFDERLTLEVMSAACKASPFHASRVFRAVTGETIHRYLTRLRLRVALFELQRGAGRLTEVALGSGFSSHSHFTSAFRAEFGCAPSMLVARVSVAVP